MERKVKTLTENWRDQCRTGTRKHTETHPNILTVTAVFLNQKRVNVCELHLCRVFTYIRSLLIEKDGHVCWNTLIKFPCACPTVISSIIGKSFHFPFHYFVLFVLRSFPFHENINFLYYSLDRCKIGTEWLVWYMQI